MVPRFLFSASFASSGSARRVTHERPRAGFAPLRVARPLARTIAQPRYGVISEGSDPIKTADSRAAPHQKIRGRLVLDHFDHFGSDPDADRAWPRAHRANTGFVKVDYARGSEITTASRKEEGLTFNASYGSARERSLKFQK